MSLVDDILTMDSAESRCSINGDTRDIVVPDEYHIFGVESDENVTRIPFICPKIVGDNVDLTGYSLYINYINGAGLGGIYVVDDVVTNGDNITFSWLLSRNVTAKAGTVSYIICAKKSGTDTKVTNEWNTKIATGTVSSGIETYDTVAQQSSDVINKLLKLTQGQSAYDIAIDNGFVGTKAAWLESLKGTDGKSAYQYAQDGGYTGTEEEFAAKLTSEALIVHVAESNGTLSADKTYVDIRDAILDGTPVLVDYGGVRFPLISMGNSLFFGATQCNETSVVTVIIEIASNDEVHDFSAQTAIPTTLPNPNALTFTGAVTGSYDGSAPLSVEIPSGSGSGMNLSLVYENTFENVTSINETIDAINGKENFVFNIEFTISADSTNDAVINNSALYNGERHFPIAYYVSYGKYSTSYPTKAAYGSFLKLGEGLWERIRLKNISVASFGNQYNFVAGNDIGLQYLRNNQESKASGLRIDFNQTMELVKVQIYAG